VIPSQKKGWPPQIKWNAGKTFFQILDYGKMVAKRV
jgi:hypothetical protein